ncbi:MAG: hypothetical protein IMW88_05305 [Thermoflavifilum sp.]|jgi:hypothetical protein|uniref:hypothetical protein n=1 Tax=Thermoflavifilum sp. TaxID=1968839 RepID=UPI0018A58D9F|nr:hypothetical protein [Thermoflavifilum sp.]QOR76947.1 MAG: hypothetical protein IMW88_05305 [Thermoflavifilum sp.]
MDDVNENWKTLEHMLVNRLGRKPGIEGVLMLIGIQEISSSRTQFSKEEKQDLIHVGTCTILAQEGYYRFIKKDKDGWPQFQQLKPLPDMDAEQQEIWLKKLILRYFQPLLEQQS